MLDVTWEWIALDNAAPDVANTIDVEKAAGVAALNRAGRGARQWTEIAVDGELQRRADGGVVERLLARYARSAMEIAADGSEKLRVCGAPSCGMFYRPRRRQQRSCSDPCGNRARLAPLRPPRLAHLPRGGRSRRVRAPMRPRCAHRYSRSYHEESTQEAETCA
jgi:hypothetical protein